MSTLRLRNRVPVQPLGPDGYQEFASGAIPIKRALTLEGRSPILFVEHARGFQRAFDEHLAALLKRSAPAPRRPLPAHLDRRHRRPGGAAARQA